MFVIESKFKFTMASKFNIYTVHLKCFDSIRYNLNQYKTLTKKFNQTWTYVHTYIHTYIHTDTVKAICPHGGITIQTIKNYNLANFWQNVIPVIK